jgi:hypothetical protein
MEEKLLEYLEELKERDDLGKLAIEWSFGAIMGAAVMGVISRKRRNELMKEYCGVEMKNPR